MASALTGPIAAFNEIIGYTIDDPKVSQIARDIGATYTVWQDEEMPDIHWIFEGKGLEFCFDEEILTAIFFQFIAEDAWNVGSWSGPLIDGLWHRTSRQNKLMPPSGSLKPSAAGALRGGATRSVTTSSTSIFVRKACT